MTEPLSALGKVVALQQMYDIDDRGTYEGDTGWILGHPTNDTVFHVDKTTGAILVAQVKWREWK